jgi:predicted secreted protein
MKMHTYSAMDSSIQKFPFEDSVWKLVQEANRNFNGKPQITEQDLHGILEAVYGIKMVYPIVIKYEADRSRFLEKIGHIKRGLDQHEEIPYVIKNRKGSVWILETRGMQGAKFYPRGTDVGVSVAHLNTEDIKNLFGGQFDRLFKKSSKDDSFQEASTASLQKFPFEDSVWKLVEEANAQISGEPQITQQDLHGLLEAVHGVETVYPFEIEKESDRIRFFKKIGHVKHGLDQHAEIPYVIKNRKESVWILDTVGKQGARMDNRSRDYGVSVFHLDTEYIKDWFGDRFNRLFDKASNDGPSIRGICASCNKLIM